MQAAAGGPPARGIVVRPPERCERALGSSERESGEFPGLKIVLEALGMRPGG